MKKYIMHNFFFLPKKVNIQKKNHNMKKILNIKLMFHYY